MRHCLFTSNISCRGNTSLDCKPACGSYATGEQATLCSDSHYTGIAGARLLAVEGFEAACGITNHTAPQPYLPSCC